MGMSGRENGGGGRARYRAAFVVTAFVVVGVVVTLPFSVVSIVDDLLGPATGKVIPVVTPSPATAGLNHSRAHLAFVALDETALIIVPGNMYYLTAMDIALSAVIIFLLGAITVRTLVFLHDRGELQLLRRRRPE